MNHIIMLLFRHVRAHHFKLVTALGINTPSPSTSVSLLYGYHRRLLQTVNVQIEYATTLKIRHQMQVKKNRARVTNSRRHDLK